ncbi:TetR/AcrR family transcriptional regulator C-terminal domain-containing protein [Microbacterium sp. MYb64]|uniref:TetR/AcrR family transcriptional regulator C-terminal domain-containing protein n=1 Tax=Microbacterium sp. MYb64 TaxID=1848691 RepID=UPI000CFE0FAD|nr:TetR/AcrR family transcriptional regulator C-terminal domain-containing protein [Microbacterium sp. MYb64]PRB07662.1 TetR family transcriptional regulator [Microbacterium sp. MYb64]
MTSADDTGPADPGVLWAATPTRRRGPKPRHSLDGIAEAAIEIADAEGLDAVTMQRVAASLGTTKMALYRYLPGRADLDAVMLDRALGAPPSPSDERWDEALTAWTGALFARALERPWSVELAQRPHTPGPQELVWYETGLAATDGLPLTAGERLDLLALLSGHALSLVRQQAGTGAAEEELAAGVAAVLTMHAGRFPRTSAVFADAGRGAQRDDALRFGVRRILAGIAALVAERTA